VSDFGGGGGGGVCDGSGRSGMACTFSLLGMRVGCDEGYGYGLIDH
jgi:hypothetical protein